MVHLFWMVFLGLCAGMVSGFWTKIIQKGMILDFINDILIKRDRRRILETGVFYESPLTKFLNCIFCLTPWFALEFCIVYGAIYKPGWLLFGEGFVCALGAGNLMAEIIYTLRRS